MPITKTTEVVVYDAHRICVESLDAALNDSKVVTATTTALAELVDLAERYQPDVCLVGLETSGERCVAAISQLAARVPRARIVVVLARPAVAVVREALAAGARGFVGDDVAPRALNHTIDRVVAGQSRVGVETFLRARSGPSAGARSSATTPLVQLTEREHEVLRRMIAGEDTRHIAAALKICRSTARTHVQNVRAKLGAQTMLQAVAYAVGTPGTSSRLTGRTIAR